jgi:tRNA G18 (ribose-2'-O)-methylase SpoU
MGTLLRCGVEYGHRISATFRVIVVRSPHPDSPLQPIHITTPDDVRLDEFRNVRDADLLGRRGVFMAEGRFVVRTLLTQSPLRCRTVLVTPPAWESVREAVEAAAAGPNPPEVLLASQEVMNTVAGFDIHRGCLAVGERPAALTVQSVLAAVPAPPNAAGIVVLENLTNHDNVGSIFRSALALGASGVLLSRGCCDPLYRKSIRVSMGAALRLPFASIPDWAAGMAVLKGAGFTVAALATGEGSLDLDVFASGAAAELSGRPRRIALLVGTEGEGLSPAALASADVILRIGMVSGVDSLNASVAAAVAMHRLFTL